MPKYILDSDTFMRAKNNEYPMDVHRAFWKWIDAQVTAGILASSMLVYEEITDGNDKLAVWAKERRDCGLFIAPTDAVQKLVGEIADYVNETYKQLHAKRFLAKADSWVIALAKVERAIVVTHEKCEQNAERVKIPNVCKKFSVGWTNIYKVQIDLKATF